MKRIIVVLLGLILVVCFVTPTNAFLINAGESKTYNFDFSAETPVPPYDGFNIAIIADLFDDAGSGRLEIFGFDVNGPWTYFSGEPGGKIYVANWRSNLSDVNLGGPSIGFTDNDFTNEFMHSLRLDVVEGSIFLKSFHLQMIERTGPNIDWISTEFVEGQIVADGVIPEPGTIILLGTGLLGIAGLRRKIRE